MGVPSLFAWWVEHYVKTILLSTLQSRTGVRKVLYLDFNGLIHPAVRTGNLNLEQMLDAVTDYLVKVFDYVKPDEMYIAIDGVAPAAKMKQQQDRRYKSAKEAKVMHEIAVKYNQPVRDQEVDFNMISPGTKFMFDLQCHLEKFLLSMCRRGKPWTNVKVTLNGAANPGEGEHKIMGEIRHRKAQGLHEQVLIYGLDADLIFLTLVNAPHAILVRENVQFKDRDRTDFYDTEKFPFIYLDISELHAIIIKTLNPKTNVDQLASMGFKNDIIEEQDVPLLCANHAWYHDTPEEHQRLILDYAYICFFLGNDFLPHLPCLKIRNGSLNEILVIYKKVAWITGGFLVQADGRNVNTRFLSEFLAEIAFIEEELLLQLADRRMKDIRSFNFKLKNLPPMNADIERFRYVEDQYTDYVRAGQPGWNIRYYQHFHGIAFHHKKDFSKQVDLMCEEYLKGTVWILHYYQGLPCSWEWLYPYHAAPTAADLANYQPRSANMEAGRLPVTDDAPVSPYVQLMSVLPPDSASLLPKCLGYYMTSRNSPIHYMYPVKITLQMIGHKWYHECKARTPHIDRRVLEDIVKKHFTDFTDEEKERNINKSEVIEWNP
jgi:5'-3' exonuclease